MSSSGGPHGDKWVAVKTDNMSGQQVAEALSDLARAGFYNQSVSAKCADGEYIFVGNYN